MRLVEHLKKLETIAAEEKPRVLAARRRVDERSRALCRESAARERVVSDMHIGEDYGGAQAWALRDRPARDEEDLGDVYRRASWSGSVERVEGSLVVYREFVNE